MLYLYTSKMFCIFQGLYHNNGLGTFYSRSYWMASGLDPQNIVSPILTIYQRIAYMFFWFNLSKSVSAQNLQ